MLLNKGTKIKVEGNQSKAVGKIAEILKRDIDTVFSKSMVNQPTVIRVQIKDEAEELPETFKLDVLEEDLLTIQSGDELGAIYGLLYISKTYLNIDPLWFFMDQAVEQKDTVEIKEVHYQSKPFYIKYRGWFVNDEVLLLGWQQKQPELDVWEKVFETLLRLGGNMVIPGTGHSSHRLRKKASSMGLWITHHHAEPLGAKMFLNEYPDKVPSYDENADLFDELWRAAVKEQKDDKVIWNIGFRGQGDRAFWDDDPKYDTMEKRGALISKLMQKQYEIISEEVPHPAICTNLYGEILELYKQGLLKFPEGTIKIWADSGYGKMVSRRQNNHNPRVYAVPSSTDIGPHGIYYHVSFYDLQASNHLTMLPNSPEFVEEELTHAFKEGANEYFILNCGNVRPHTYLLELIQRLWQDGEVNIKEHRESFVNKHFKSAAGEVSKCLEDYFKATIQYGCHGDERAGEQFYNYLSRAIINFWIKGEKSKTENRLYWATGDMPFEEQVLWFKSKCEEGMEGWEALKQKSQQVKDKLKAEEGRLFADWFETQVSLHESGCMGSIALGKSYEAFKEGTYEEAFVYAMAAKNCFNGGVESMQKACHGKWEGYYDNDCLTNVKLTVYCLETLSRYIRMLGDAPNFYKWEKEYLYPKEESGVTLITNIKNHLEDEELARGLAQKLGIVYK